MNSQTQQTQRMIYATPADAVGDALGNALLSMKCLCDRMDWAALTFGRYEEAPPEWVLEEAHAVLEKLEEMSNE